MLREKEGEKINHMGTSSLRILLGGTTYRHVSFLRASRAQLQTLLTTWELTWSPHDLTTEAADSLTAAIAAPPLPNSLQRLSLSLSLSLSAPELEPSPILSSPLLPSSRVIPPPRLLSISHISRTAMTAKAAAETIGRLDFNFNLKGAYLNWKCMNYVNEIVILKVFW